MVDEEGEVILRDTLAQREKTLGSTHSQTLWSIEILSDFLKAAHRHDEALALLQKTIIMCSNTLGRDHISK